MKIGKNWDFHYIEKQILTGVENNGHSNFPKLYADGDIHNAPFLIQERLGKTLDFY